MSTHTSASYFLGHVPASELLANLKGLVGRSNRLTAQLLAHLAEVDERGVYRELACASLHTYCVYELRMSEDEASRRITAARTARRFPVIFEMLEGAAIHLTGIILLAPHLTDQNHADVLARARFRTKKEILKLVREIAPLPGVPAIVEPLGPEPGPLRPPGRPTWARLVEALAGPVRDIPSGNGPRQAPVAPDDARDADDEHAWTSADQPSPARTEDGAGFRHAFEKASAPARIAEGVTTRARASAPSAESDAPDAHQASAPARIAEGTAAQTRESVGPCGPPHRIARPQRYKVQFTADQGYVDLLEEACDLLKHELHGRDIAEVQRRAMQALVEKLRKRKRADTAQPRPRKKTSPSAPPSAGPGVPTGVAAGRHIPAEVVRSVWQRDAAQCAFVDHRGQRCRETAGLELHHEQPYCQGGPATVENISLRCRAHNQLEAERELGRDFVERKKTGRQRGPRADHPERLSDGWTPAGALRSYESPDPEGWSHELGLARGQQALRAAGVVRSGQLGICGQQALRAARFAGANSAREPPRP